MSASRAASAPTLDQILNKPPPIQAKSDRQRTTLIAVLISIIALISIALAMLFIYKPWHHTPSAAPAASPSVALCKYDSPLIATDASEPSYSLKCGTCDYNVSCAQTAPILNNWAGKGQQQLGRICSMINGQPLQGGPTTRPCVQPTPLVPSASPSGPVTCAPDPDTAPFTHMTVKNMSNRTLTVADNGGLCANTAQVRAFPPNTTMRFCCSGNNYLCNTGDWVSCERFLATHPDARQQKGDTLSACYANGALSTCT